MQKTKKVSEFNIFCASCRKAFIVRLRNKNKGIKKRFCSAKCQMREWGLNHPRQRVGVDKHEKL
jgi:hypothetical protein